MAWHGQAALLCNRPFFLQSNHTRSMYYQQEGWKYSSNVKDWPAVHAPVPQGGLW